MVLPMTVLLPMGLRCCDRGTWGGAEPFLNKDLRRRPRPAVDAVSCGKQLVSRRSGGRKPPHLRGGGKAQKFHRADGC